MLLQNKYQAITERVIGCAMEVHCTLGSGFQEVIYQRSLAVEMEKAESIFGREVEMPLFYKGVDVGSRRADFLVADAVLVELKALHENYANALCSDYQLLRSLSARGWVTH